MSSHAHASLALVPWPQHVEQGAGTFFLPASIPVQIAPELAGARDALALLLHPAGFDTPEFATAGVGGAPRMIFSYEADLHPEGYRLRVDPDGVAIAASADAGAFYALQTLRQLLPAGVFGPGAGEAERALPFVTIEDEPRFAWRGLHLDVGRHFMPVAFIKKYIDLLALHKMNTFHWHLTEDQGWRIEIMKYPKLTEIGAWRAQTVVGNPLFARGEPEYDGIPHGGFYTQEEVREVVAYAAARHVTVVPEIEFPGHAQAAIAAYPWLGNTREPLPVKEEWGINRNTIKPSEETLAFYRDVLTEVMALFPSTYIHIGGDEAPKDQWEESEFARSRMEELGLADGRALQSWLIGQMDEFLTAHGRRLVGWDEIVEGGLSPNATVMSWRGVKPGLRAARAGHDVIMAPTGWTYFDYYQGDPGSEPLAIGSYLPLRKVYAFDPAPASLEEATRARILGAQGQLWTEFMKTPEHVEYMAYPRAAALAEVVWTPQAQRDYADFQRRLGTHLERLHALGVNYRPPGEDGLGLAATLQNWLWQAGMGIYFWLQTR